jgi:hypothetical protein
MSGGQGAGAGGAEVDQAGDRDVDAEDAAPDSGGEPEPHESGDEAPDAGPEAEPDPDPKAEPDADPEAEPDAERPVVDAADDGGTANGTASGTAAPDDGEDTSDDAEDTSDDVEDAPDDVDAGRAVTTVIDVDAAAAPPGPRFVPPPYDPASIPPDEPVDAYPEPVPPPAVRPPVRQQYVTGPVPIVEIEGGWEAVYRRRRRQTMTFVAGFAVVLVVGFLAWLTYVGVVPWPFDGTARVAQSVCTHSQPPPPKAISVRVFNGSSRDGLAGQVAAQLKKLGFAVKATGNDPLEASIRTQVEIRHGEEGDIAAATMSAYVVGRSKDVQDDRRDGSIDLVLGPSFTRLHSKSELKKSLAAVTSTLPMTCPPGVTPTATPTPTASTTPKARVTPRPRGTPRR